MAEAAVKLRAAQVREQRQQPGLPCPEQGVLSLRAGGCCSRLVLWRSQQSTGVGRSAAGSVVGVWPLRDRCICLRMTPAKRDRCALAIYSITGADAPTRTSI